MLAKVFLLCAFVAAAHSTGLYGSGILAPGLYNYNSGILAPGLLNTVVAPGYAVKGAPFLSAPIAAAIPTAYTSKTVVTAPVTYAKAVIAAPMAYAARPVIAAPIAYAAKPVVAAPAAITTHKTVIGATSLLTGTPLVYSSGLYSAPLALNTGIVSPIGLKGAGFLAGSGLVKTILK